MRLLLACLLGIAACGREGSVRLATTTSTENSGLLAAVLPAFTAETGIRVDVLAMGTGKALKTAERGDCDIVLVHAPDLETAFVAAGHGTDRTYLMWNDFLLLGPPDDPARVKGSADAAAALARVAAERRPFCSRGDESGTHQKEKELWRAAAVSPAGDWYRNVGQGMEETLRVAHEMRAYVLADRGTWLSARKGLDLAPLVEGDMRLSNPYHAILVNPSRHEGIRAGEAKKLLDWLRGEEGQRRIGAFRVDGETLFHPAATRD